MKCDRPTIVKILLSIGCILFETPQILAQRVQEIAKKSFPSIVLVELEDAHGQPLSLGSGFVVDNEIVATNVHVIEDACGGYVKLVGKHNKHKIAGTVAFDYRNDLALLKVNGIKAPIMTLGDSDKLEIGDEVYAIGNPKGLEGTLSCGIISGLRTIKTEKLLQITAPISPGSSGGPVLDSKGMVIGISFATFKDGQNLNFAIPVSYLKALLKKTNKPFPLTNLYKRPAESIISEFGEKSTQGITCSHTLWNQLPSSITFSVRNNLRQPVENIQCMIIFADKDYLPIETKTFLVQGPIPPHITKRSSAVYVGSDVRYLTKNVIYRILDFEMHPDPSVAKRYNVEGLIFDVPSEWIPVRVCRKNSIICDWKIPPIEGDVRNYTVTLLCIHSKTLNYFEQFLSWADERLGISTKDIKSETFMVDDLKVTYSEPSESFNPEEHQYSFLDVGIVDLVDDLWFIRVFAPPANIAQIHNGFTQMVRSIHRPRVFQNPKN
ncbi:MAG: S1C family serine protease [Planctomycetota bacterium]|jgi:hypothetical protein